MSYFFHADWSTAYESPYCVAHKFMWINSQGPELVAQLFGLSPKAFVSDQARPKSLLSGTWMASTTESHLSGMPPPATLRAQFLDDICGRWAELLGTTELRFCPECLHHGFHSSIFQLKHLGSCPLHRLPLTSKCPNCGDLLGAFELSKRSLSRRCGCSRCDYTWAPEVGELARWFNVRQHREQFKSAASAVVSWLREAKLVVLLQLPQETRPLRYLELEGCHLWYSFLRNSIGPLPQEKGVDPPGCLRSIPDWSAPSFGIDSEPAWQNLSRVFRSVRKHIECYYLARHRLWIWDYREVDLSDQLNNPGFQRFQPPVVLAYRIWRSTIQRAREGSEETSGSSFFTTRFLEVFKEEGSEEMTESFIAQCMLSYFFALCFQTKHLLLTKRRELASGNQDTHSGTVLIRIAVKDWYRRFMQPFIGLDFGKSPNHVLRSAPSRTGTRYPALVAARGAAEELRATIDDGLQKFPDEYAVLERAIRSGEMGWEVFTSTGWPSISRRHRRRLRKRPNFQSTPGSV